MRILVIGGGGREHAIVRALKRNTNYTIDVLCAPGNAGIARDATCFDIADTDVDALVHLAVAEDVGLVVVGPESSLVNGVVDGMHGAGVPAFGPTAEAARLEGSKVFAKEIMAATGVPTGAYAVLNNKEEAIAQLASVSYPVVLKADGLAAGKGVIICTDQITAHAAIEAFFVKKQFGETKVVLEEYLVGDEVSLLAICDGEHAIPLTPARDYKRIFDGDRGPNTGGMGSISPIPGMGPDHVHELSRMVHQPIVDELARRDKPFHGVLYAGLMMTASGPKVLEYNCRFGDPETQAILPRFKGDLARLFASSVTHGGLTGFQLAWKPEYAVTITLASAGYPSTPTLGDPILGLSAIPDDVEVTHAGTAMQDDQIVTNGGRVLNVTALGRSPGAARDKAYAAANLIQFEGRQMRTDIAAGIL